MIAFDRAVRFLSFFIAAAGKYQLAADRRVTRITYMSYAMLYI
jgi:hypothetical protein